ncbi:MAG: hypothetical protein AAF788_00505 [Pseudomonadota bacterium]
MIRIVCLMALTMALTTSAIFRLHTETGVRHEIQSLALLEREQANLEAEIERLNFEVEVLESAPRLNELSADRLPLAPGGAQQVADGEVLRDVLDPVSTWELRR